jgi:hypothetical protein
MRSTPSSRPWPTSLQMIHPPPTPPSKSRSSRVFQHTRASRLRDGHGHDHGHRPPTQPLLHSHQSIASHPQQPHISLPGRSPRAHSLLEQPFVSSLHSAVRTLVSLAPSRPSMYPGSMVQGQRYPSSRMGTSHRHADLM